MISIPRICRIIALITSIPLIIISYLYLLSGYALLKPSIVENLTLGLIDYRKAVLIHLNPLTRWILIALASIHSTTGLWLTTYSVKNTVLRLILRISIVLLSVLIILHLAIIEVLHA